jgi:glycosyltransferase involved in cell wall biosynthesis
MISNQIYYRVKPFVPWRIRMAARRFLAQRQRHIHSKTWPINEAAGKTPDGWRGWPEGKKFAFVLTHDIEGAAGFEKYPELMRLEQELGFRSSFNFIPEGEYRISREQIADLKQNGFEVGVHDLRHDGKLFWKHLDFTESARAINGYLRDWGAHGFRSGFMLHDLACLNELEIEYDASTFDTDPFEPQPEGTNTIFPFWITRPGGGGYVELPYTLPQDSTMFFVLQETTLDIWKKKLDWIAQCGGMALFNVHPDYVNFSSTPGKPWEYPAGWYREFLQYAAQKYGGAYWQALPHQVAAWYRENCVSPELKNAPAVPQPLKNKNAAVVLYSYYASDPRPRRETEALAQAGMNVDVICLRQNAEEPSVEVIDGVTVHRVPLKRRRAGKFTYAFQYAAFLTSAFFMLTWWRLRRRIDLVHVHNMPDFLVFSALLPKILGARVILDLHDPMPELLVTIFGLEEKSFGVRLLKFMEKLSVGFADQVLTVNRACEEIFSARSCPAEKIQVLMNVPDERVFKFRSCLDYPLRDQAKPFVIMFHGSIVERNGLDIAVDALRLLRAKVPDAELWVYGADTPFLQKVMEPAALNGLGGAVKYLGPKSQKEIVAAIQGCDVGVIPNRNNAFTEINTPTRIFEYLSVGKPVVAPRAKGITDYFGPDDLVYFQLGDASQLAAQLEFIHRQPDRAREIALRGQEIYQQQRWSSARGKFIGRVCGLLGIKEEKAEGKK